MYEEFHRWRTSLQGLRGSSTTTDAETWSYASWPDDTTFTYGPVNRQPAGDGIEPVIY